LGLRDATLDPAQILDTLNSVLKEIFVTRAANEVLQLGLKWLPFEKRCKIDSNGAITFDIEKFVRDYLADNNATAHFENFMNCRSDLLAVTLDCQRKGIRGHDYANLLNKYLGTICANKEAKELARCKAITRLLFVALDPKDLISAPLFQKIANSFVSNA
jgi:hypothetical protein